MHFRQFFDEPYLNAFDLDEKGTPVVIRAIETAIVRGASGETKKPLVYFDKFQKPAVFNKTNCNTVSNLYGPHTPDWIGKPIVLYPSEVTFQGTVRPCIRVKAPEKPKRDATNDEATPAK